MVEAFSELNKPGVVSRRVVWEILQTVSAGAYADVALERCIAKYQLNASDRGLVKEIAFGAIRHRLTLDCWIDFLGKRPVRKQPPLLRWLLHVGLYQIFYMDRIPYAAAVNTAVDLAKTGNLLRLAPVVNGLLRASIRAKSVGQKLPIPDCKIQRFAQDHSFPDWLAEKLFLWRDFQSAEQIAIASNQVPPIDLRVNRLRTTPEKLKRDFACAGIDSSLINDCPYGLRIASGAGDIRNWPGFSDGLWSVQDSSSQWVAPLLEVKPGDRVLDACSAPGGKTTQLAELMDDIGDLWAVDRSPDRLNKVFENVQRLDLKCVKTVSADATLLCEKKDWLSSFDKILLDAPCSGLGTLARNPDARWRISLNQIKKLVQLQRSLLESLIPLLIPGGRIVYSTCTINPQENFQQINNLLESHQELKLLFEKQIWPSSDYYCDGFYSAVLQLK